MEEFNILKWGQTIKIYATQIEEYPHCKNIFSYVEESISRQVQK